MAHDLQTELQTPRKDPPVTDSCPSIGRRDLGWEALLRRITLEGQGWTAKVLDG